MDKLPYFKSNKYDDDGSFFELNAKRLNGKNLDFERFIGFVSTFTNIHKRKIYFRFSCILFYFAAQCR